MDTFTEARPGSPFGPCWDDYAKARARFFAMLHHEPDDRTGGAVASPADAAPDVEPATEAST